MQEPEFVKLERKYLKIKTKKLSSDERYVFLGHNLCNERKLNWPTYRSDPPAHYVFFISIINDDMQGKCFLESNKLVNAGFS